MSHTILPIALTIIYYLLLVNANFRNNLVDDLLVNTNYGYVLGSLAYSRNSREFASFRGIPYAKPPVGELRFQNPRPPQMWNSPYNATLDGPICLQPEYPLPPNELVLIGQEDCLYLNIYVPLLEDGSDDLLPVMVFIHGGAFITGASASNWYGPRYFMDKDVILVTVNYRLGPLGFLATLDDEAPGNFALKDQVMALRFVNENIENFGGDKNKVTIFGESAGSVCVGIHLLSPLSNGLYQQAISQSGSEILAWRLDNNAKQLNATNTLAAFIGCEDFIGDSGSLVECLRGLDVETIVGAYLMLHISMPAAVIEVKTERNSEPLLEKSPLDYIESGEIKKIPFIIGANQDEGIYSAGPILKVNETLAQFNANFDAMLPDVLSINPRKDAEGVVRNVTEFYLDGDHFINVNDPTKIQGFIDMLSDRMFHYSTDQIIKAQYLNGHESIWVYNFDYRGNYSYVDILGPSEINFNWGVAHADDIQYLFESPGIMGPIQLDGLDVEVSEKLVTLWTNFATFGDPDPNEDFSWSKLNFGSDVSSENLNYVNITGSLVGGSIAFQGADGYFAERMNFWEQLNFEEN